MQSRIIFSIIMAFVAPCLFAQQTDSVVTKVEEAYVMPRPEPLYGLRQPLWPQQIPRLAIRQSGKGILNKE